MNVQKIKISEIRRDEEQPRKYFDEEALERLTQSIKDNGVEQPIIVRQNGSGYVIVDGERRFRASQQAGVQEIDCIITDKDDILEQQLRSDCLKEGLTTDELDKAIYRYYEGLVTSYHSKRESKDEGYRFIAKQIGKSHVRVRIAIDRFEFKKQDPEFSKKIQEKHNPENKPYSKVNSTIAMTDKLKDKPEVRKAVVEAILDNRKKEKFGLNNEKIKKQIDVIVEKAKSATFEPEDVAVVIEDMNQKADPMKMLKNDPRYLFESQYFEFGKFIDSFYDFEFDTVKDYLAGGDLIKKFINDSEQFTEYLKSLEA